MNPPTTGHEATPSTATESVAESYRRLHGDRLAVVQGYQSRESQFSWVRLGLFAAAIAVAAAAWRGTLSWYGLIVPVAGFIVVAVIHDRMIRRRRRAERAVAFYDSGLTRLNGTWQGRGVDGTEFSPSDHPYAGDLDLFGSGSLFELLCTARTRAGRRTLADWLLAPASSDGIRQRQRSIEELRPRTDLREELALTGEEIDAGIHADELTRWAASPAVLSGLRSVAVAGVLALANVGTLVAWVFTEIGAELGYWSGPVITATPFLISAFVGTIFALSLRSRVDPVLAAVRQPEHDLELLGQLLARLERLEFSSPRLRQLRASLETDGESPSRQISRLVRLVELNDSRANKIFAPIAALLFVGTQLAFALERWRARSGPAVRRWVDAVGEIEALACLAGYAHEHPDDPFPEVVDGEACFVGHAVGHPLIDAGRCVRNDIRLDAELRLVLISGSNMSGKSTMLRTVGVNAVLALAGGPVRADQLRISPMAIGACMRVVDSLQQGLSHFYAEIKRLSGIVESSADGRPLLFLLDEILHGTNSHDRRVGAEAVIRSLLDRGNVGLVTTHDLALAEIVDALAPLAVNAHFEDQLDGDRIVFDYRLRPGVVSKGNALALMRAVGLKV